jgi:hypothetical protein
MIVSYYLRKIDLEGVDVISLWQTLKAIGYQVLIGNGLLVQTIVGPFDSMEHIKKELIMDVETLLKRFKIKN